MAAVLLRHGRSGQTAGVGVVHRDENADPDRGDTGGVNGVKQVCLAVEISRRAHYLHMCQRRVPCGLHWTRRRGTLSCASLPQRVPCGLHGGGFSQDPRKTLCLSAFHADCIRSLRRAPPDQRLCPSAFHADCIAKLHRYYAAYLWNVL